MRLKIYDVLTNSFDKVNKKDGLYDWKKIKKLIGIDPCYMFNLETEKRAGLFADTTSKLMRDIAPKWWNYLNDNQKEKAIDYILNAVDDDELALQLHSIKSIEEQELVKLLKVKLKDGYGSVSIKFIDKVLPFLEFGQQYSDACISAGYNHSKPNETGEVFEQLPFYGEVLSSKVIGGNSKIENINNPEKYFGKINNPTVHIALNQIRALLNDLTNRYGRPSKVNIEFAREVAMSATQKSKIKKEQERQQKENEKINEILTELNVTPNSNNRMKYKIWSDLSKSPMEKCCPLSGKTISIENLFNGEFEIEHIIPFSRSYNDSRNNKMICSREMNAKKGNRTPYEMFIDNVFTQKEWDTIIARVQNGMPQKIKGFTKEGIPSKENQDFIARQLNDTRYMALVARDYIKFLVGDNNVNSLKGVYTSVLRDKWGLNYLVETTDKNNKIIKDRTKHSHHAVDAFVIALTGNNVINKLGKAFSKEYGKIKDLAPPLNNFNEVRDKLAKFIDNLVVSHKYDHGISKLGLNNSTPGELHKETAYGHIVDNIYATRKPLTANLFDKDDKIIEIANPKIREHVLHIFKNKLDIKDYGIKLDEYCKKHNIKKLEFIV